MKTILSITTTIFVLCLILIEACPVYAGTALSTDRLVQCNSSGVISNNTAITGVNLPVQFDVTENYSAVGADVAIYTGSALIKELDGFNTTLLSVGLGEVTNYDYHATSPVVYEIKYRGQYIVIGENSHEIIETWKSTGLYFRVSRSAVTYTVTFNKNGGNSETSPTSKTAASGGNVGTFPASPTRTGYTFSGWNTAANGSGTEFTTTTTVTSNITIYAKWISSGDGSTDNNSGKTELIPEPTKPPSKPSETYKTITASTTIPGQMDASTGAATAQLEAGTINTLIDKAKVSETAGMKVVVEIKVEAPSTAKSVEVEIPRAAFDKVADATKAEVKVNTAIGSITFSTKAVETISGAASTGKISISIAKVETATLSKEIQKKIGDRPVFDFSVKAGNTEISKFNGGSAEISIPYTMKAGENKNAVIVYYIDNAGKLKSIRGKYDVATGSIIFTTTHFSQYAVGYNEVNFIDVPNTTWYYEAVGFIAAREITAGIGNGSFGAEGKLTRGQLLVMVMKAYGVAPDENPADNFVDAGNTYYTQYLAAAKRLGISQGTGNNFFAPDKEITRQEMFTLLYNTLKSIGELPEGKNGKVLSEYKDSGKIESWAREAMTLFVETGIIIGSGDRLNPLNATNRAEMAQVLYNTLIQLNQSKLVD